MARGKGGGNRAPRNARGGALASRSVGGLELAVVFTIRGEHDEITRSISTSGQNAVNAGNITRIA
jgi:hypothetical protein